MGLNHHSFESLLHAAKKVGFRGIEVPAGAFDTDLAAKEARKRMESMGLRFGLIMAPCDMYKVDDAIFSRSLKVFDEWSYRASLAGCTRAYNHIWPGSDERDYQENFDWHANRLNAIYQILSKNGISYGLEFMGPIVVQQQFRHPFIRSLMGLVSLTQTVSHDIGFVFDTIHWYCSGSSRDDLFYALMHSDKVINLHLCDATTVRNKQPDHKRAMPMETGIIDSIEIVHLFAKYGYDGPVIIEPMKPTTTYYQNIPLESAAKEAIDRLHYVMGQAGAVDG